MSAARIMITAGEASADQHAAGLIRAIKKTLPEAEFFGMGGPDMIQEGFEACHAMEEFAVMGFSAVIPKILRIIRIYRDLKELMLRRRPDLFIPIDLPDFNMRLGAFAHRHGIKVLYFIAPQAWAWRRYRARQLARITDGLAVIFPFEEAFFRGYGVNARYVGHPILEHAPQVQDVHWPPTRIAIMPGSRRDEIVRMLPIMMGAKRIISQRYRDVRWFLPVAPGIDENLVRRTMDTDVILTEGLPEVDLAMVKSGTATFEMALKGVPEVICYTTSRLNYAVAKIFITVEHIGMPNLAAGRTVVPELIQDACTPENLAFSLLRYMDDRTLYGETRTAFRELRSSLGSKPASYEVAQWVRDLL